MEKSAEVSIDVKPTCAPQFTRVAKQLGIDTRFTRGCLAGLTYCVVGSEGIVRPCAYMTEEAGDVRTQPFDEIWKTSPVFERLRTQAYSGACGTCDYKDGCGGCRARAAYYHDGDILAQDDYCAHGQQLDVHSAIADNRGVRFRRAVRPSRSRRPRPPLPRLPQRKQRRPVRSPSPTMRATRSPWTTPSAWWPAWAASRTPGSWLGARLWASPMMRSRRPVGPSKVLMWPLWGTSRQ